MGFNVNWSDGSSNEIVPYASQYNWNGASWLTTGTNAGFVTVNGVLGIFSDANNRLPVSHTFSGTSGGFTISWGLSAGSSVNDYRPFNFRQLSQSGGDTPSVTFATPPSNAYVNKTGSSCTSISTSSGFTAGTGSTNYQRVEWSKDGWATYGTSPYSTNNPFNYTITGLDPGSAYLIRTWVYNDVGGVNSGVQTMSTSGSDPQL